MRNSPAASANGQKFFGSFFQKRTLSSISEIVSRETKQERTKG
jgi:hypothetical protein